MARSSSRGFPDDAFVFFETVAPDVSWAFVRERRGEWERDVHVPIEDLLDTLTSEFGESGYAYNRPSSDLPAALPHTRRFAMDRTVARHDPGVR